MNATVLHTTSSLCAACKRGIEAEIVEVDGGILMRKRCPDHGAQEVLIASDAAWYHRVMGMPAALKAPEPRREVDAGCPFDCGACTSHQQSVYLPVVPITSACNLDCPICYTINKNDDAWHVPLDEFRAILAQIRRRDPRGQIINLTGGEPTMHPRLGDIVRACHDAGLHRVTISTHGLTFIPREELLAELASLDARMVLSFDSFLDQANAAMVGATKMHAAKMRVLEQFAKHGVDTTLLCVIAHGVNDAECGQLLDLALRLDQVRSLEVHTMCFTGQGGARFDQRTRITVPDVLRRLAAGSGGMLAVDDFVPSPCAHPLCYQTAYLLRTDAGHVPFTRFMSTAQVRELLTDNLYMEPGGPMETVIRGVIDELWSREAPGAEGDQVLAALKRLLRELFPERPLPYAQRQRIAERAAKTVYVHSHMDEGNFDTDRVRQCCVGVPDAGGHTVPTCSYNVLYRERDPRFSTRHVPALTAMPGGRRWGSP